MMVLVARIQIRLEKGPNNDLYFVYRYLSIMNHDSWRMRRMELVTNNENTYQ